MKNQKGLSLIEALAFMALSGVVISGAVAMFSSAQTAAQSNSLASDVLAARTNVKALLAMGIPYSQATTSRLIVLGRLPAGMVNVPVGDCDNPAIEAPCAKYASGVAMKVTGTTNDFTVQVGGFTQAVCENLKQRMANTELASTPACLGTFEQSDWRVSFIYN